MDRKSTKKITVKTKSDPASIAMKAGIIVGVLIILVIGANFLIGQNTGNLGSPGNTYTHDDIFTMCIDHATIARHYHWNLEIYLNGEKYTMPSNIGVQSNCMRPVHTHDTSGTVHVELPDGAESMTPSVGDFFQIWGQTLAPNELLGQQGSLTVTLNGQSYDAASMGDYTPNDGDTIVLSLNSS